MNQATDDSSEPEGEGADEAVPMGSEVESSGSQDAGRRPEPTRNHRIGVAVGLLVVMLVAIGVGVRPPKVIISPGDGDPVGPSIQIQGTQSYPNDGEVLFLTVLVSNQRPTLFELAAAAIDDNTEIVDEKTVLGTQTRQQNDKLDRALMAASQAAAKQAALRRLGYTVTETGTGAVVRAVVPKSPAEGIIERGDLITAVDDVPVTTQDALGVQIRARAPGTPVRLKVQRGDAVSTLTVGTVASETGTTVVGVLAVTADPQFTYPFEIAIDPGDVSGPSAGLAFTLGIIDALTPGDITGGKKVAATGTITPDGLVGPVGGVTQKAVAAKDSGARLLLVPASEVEEARSSGVDIQVVGVKTLDEALAALVAIGGAPVPNP